jgi:transcriptional regulator with XRE-family HTH domain
MTLGQKIRYLRLVEGELRGLAHDIGQQELARAIKAETGQSISQSYLSQIESGARPHLTNASRLLLARFFKVHPGYLVDDPPGYHTELTSELRTVEARLDRWLLEGAEHFGSDPELRQALAKLARAEDTRGCLLLLSHLVHSPDLVERLMDALRAPAQGESPAPPEIGWLQ